MREDKSHSYSEHWISPFLSTKHVQSLWSHIEFIWVTHPNKFASIPKRLLSDFGISSFFFFFLFKNLYFTTNWQAQIQMICIPMYTCPPPVSSLLTAPPTTHPLRCPMECLTIINWVRYPVWCSSVHGTYSLFALVDFINSSSGQLK